MARTRYILPALLALSLGLVLWVDPTGAVSGMMGLDTIPGGGFAYALLLLGGILLGVLTLRDLDAETPRRTSEPAQEYINIPVSPVKQEKPLVRQLKISERKDIEHARALLRSQPYVLILDVTGVPRDECKRWLRQLQHTVEARQGRLIGLDSYRILATSEIEIRNN